MPYPSLPRPLPCLSAADPPACSTGIHDKINVCQFDRGSLHRAGIADCGTPTPPFLVIASNDINEELNAGAATKTPLGYRSDCCERAPFSESETRDAPLACRLVQV